MNALRSRFRILTELTNGRSAIRTGRRGEEPEALPPPPDELDLLLRDEVIQHVAALRSEHATVFFGWSDQAARWVTSASPRSPDAASMSFGVIDEDGIDIEVGHMYFQTYGPVKESLADLRLFIVAVFAGQVEEIGRPDDGFARLGSGSNLWRVGATHLPIPWGWRRPTLYAPYTPNR